MYELDVSWIHKLGYTQLSDEDARSLADAAYSELELRVGTALSQDMTNEQLEEFQSLRDSDVAVAVAWAEREGIDPTEDDLFATMTRSATSCEEMEHAFCQWASTRWVAVNRPDYKDVVAACFATIERELKQKLSRSVGQPQIPSQETPDA